MVDGGLRMHMATQTRLRMNSTPTHLAAQLCIYSIPVNPLPTRKRPLVLPLPRMHRNSRQGAPALWVVHPRARSTSLLFLPIAQILISLLSHPPLQLSMRCLCTQRKSFPSSSSSQQAFALSPPCWPCSHTSSRSSWASLPKQWVLPPQAAAVQ